MTRQRPGPGPAADTITKATVPPDDDTQPYADLEQQIMAAEDVAIQARWRFGKLLLAEREANGGKQLPDGRLADIRAATGVGVREIQLRMRFAEHYPEDQQVRTAVRTLRTWTAIRDKLGLRSEPPRPAPGWRAAPGAAQLWRTVASIRARDGNPGGAAQAMRNARMGTTPPAPASRQPRSTVPCPRCHGSGLVSAPSATEPAPEDR